MIWPVHGPTAGAGHPPAFEIPRLPVRAGDGNRTRMTSLEDRYRSVRLDVLIHTCWSRASDDPPLTVSALGSSRHLVRVWPADLPLRRSFRRRLRPARVQVGGRSRCPWVTADDRSFPPVLARMWHTWAQATWVAVIVAGANVKTPASATSGIPGYR
jgi:hypothetical protein